MLSETVRRRLHPEGYQGAARRAPYFDGWYFKVVDAAEQARYAIIPGISLAKEDGGPHSFVQVLDGVTGDTLYQRYTVEAFAAAADTLDVMVGPNRFTWRGMTLDLGSSRLPLRGTIAFRGVQPWPVTLLSPGIMGWYAWAPFMECYHGVLSLDHGLTGTLETGAGAVSFDGGRGYIEKDWGQAFPSAWIWLQTNHFATPGTCLTSSVARIPWIGTAFSGFIVGLLWNGQLYRFATYTGARTVALSTDESAVRWIVEDALYRLTLVAHHAELGALCGPTTRDMGRPVSETLRATVPSSSKVPHQPRGTSCKSRCVIC